MATGRTFTGSNFMLTLAGVACGFVDAVDGGGIVANVVEVRDDTSPGTTRKVVGSYDFEPLTVETGFALGQDLYDWIAATWSGTFARKDCSITAVDMQLNAKSELRCHNALLTSVSVGACDAASKDVLRLGLTVTPETVQDVPASGKVAGAGPAPKQKQVMAASFRLELDGVDCTGVRRIDPFTVQLQVTEDTTGTNRLPEKLPAKLDFPNLAVTLADNAAAASWRSWAADFIVNGDRGATEKNGAIVFLAADAKTELGRVELHRVGICGLGYCKRTAHADAIPTLVAELFCEAMTFHVGASAPVPVPGRVPVPVPVPERPKPSPVHPVTPIR